jgi:hypothetical protein
MIYANQGNKFYSVGNKFLTPKIPYIFNVNIISIPTVQGFTADPPCPRVNTWAEGGTISPYVTSITSFRYEYDVGLQGEAGIDTFVWNQFQAAYIEYDGNPIVLTEPAGQGDQTKYQIRYTTPNTYNITIEVIPKPKQCNEAVTITRSGFTPCNSPYLTSFDIGSETGYVRVVGSAKSSPDRLIFEINNVIVLDTMYRGSSSYQSEVDAYDISCGRTPTAIIQCNTCGTTIQDHGDFDLFFEKTTTDSILRMSAIMPINESANNFDVQVYCPVKDQPSIFGFNVENFTGVKS